MNRLLLIPFLAASGGFAWLVMSPPAPTPPIEKYGDSQPDRESSRLLEFTDIRDMLLTRFDESGSTRRVFSRAAPPRQRWQQREVFVQEYQPWSETFFAASFIFRDPESRKIASSHALLVDRRTGETLVYSGTAWQEFDEWATQF